jgi:hypothetical protein
MSEISEMWLLAGTVILAGIVIFYKIYDLLERLFGG